MFQESRCFLFLSSRLKKTLTASSASICFSILLRLFDIIRYFFVLFRFLAMRMRAFFLAMSSLIASDRSVGFPSNISLL